MSKKILSYSDLMKERDEAVAAFNQIAEQLAHRNLLLLHMERELRKREKSKTLCNGGESAFTTGAFIQQVSLQEHTAWVVTSFEDSTFQDGEGIDVVEYKLLPKDEQWTPVNEILSNAGIKS